MNPLLEQIYIYMGLDTTLCVHLYRFTLYTSRTAPCR